MSTRNSSNADSETVTTPPTSYQTGSEADFQRLYQTSYGRILGTAAAIVLRHYPGYTNRAIAQALGIPERTVASRLAIAKQRLRGMLSQTYGAHADEPQGVERGFAPAAD